MLLENFLNHFVFSLELSTLIWQINFSSLGEKCHASKILGVGSLQRRPPIMPWIPQTWLILWLIWPIDYDAYDILPVPDLGLKRPCANFHFVLLEARPHVQKFRLDYWMMTVHKRREHVEENWVISCDSQHPGTCASVRATVVSLPAPVKSPQPVSQEKRGAAVPASG